MKSSNIIALGAVVLVGAVFAAGEDNRPIATEPSAVEIVEPESSFKPAVVPSVKTIPAKMVEAPPAKSTTNCHPNYSGCLKADASDYDCAGGSGNGPYYTGRVQVYGRDPFDLDRDNDGIGCE